MKSRTTNTVPYTNARLAGRTHPGLIEMRDDDTLRFFGIFPTGRGILPNRGYIRRYKKQGMQTHNKVKKAFRYTCILCHIRKVPWYRTEQLCSNCLGR